MYLAFNHIGDGMLDTTHIGIANRNLSGMQFSARDEDNDMNDSGNCADSFKGGWWFNHCYIAFLNGPWAPESWAWPWYPTITSGSDIKETRMMIKAH
jgi:ficolin